MTTTYRVEAHDGNRWGFGIRVNDNSKMPEFLGLDPCRTVLKPRRSNAAA
jgi:hypothetical protein